MNCFVITRPFILDCSTLQDETTITLSVRLICILKVLDDEQCSCCETHVCTHTHTCLLRPSITWTTQWENATLNTYCGHLHSFTANCQAKCPQFYCPSKLSFTIKREQRQVMRRTRISEVKQEKRRSCKSAVTTTLGTWFGQKLVLMEKKWSNECFCKQMWTLLAWMMVTEPGSSGRKQSSYRQQVKININTTHTTSWKGNNCCNCKLLGGGVSWSPSTLGPSLPILAEA